MNTTNTPALSADTVRLTTLEVRVGNPYDHHGQTVASVSGSGAFRGETIRAEQPRPKGESADPAARHEKPIEPRRCQAELPAEHAERILRQAAEFAWGAKFPPRPGIPGEAVVEWRLKTPQGDFVLKSWLRDAEKDSRQAEVLKAIKETLQKASGDKMVL